MTSLTIEQSEWGLIEVASLPASTFPAWRLRLMARRIERKALRLKRRWRRQGHGNMTWDQACLFVVWDLCGTPIVKLGNGRYRVSALHRPRRPSDWATALSIANP